MSPNNTVTNEAAWSQLRSPAHGFCDDDATRRLLRTRPPPRALRWAESHLDGTVVSARALRGGMSSAVHLVTVEHQCQHRQAVMRRYVRTEVNEEEPDLVEREAQALEFVEQIEVATPHLMAVDPTGDEAGVPALLMSRLPGRVDWWPKDMERWLRRMADVLPQIHAAPQPPPGIIRPYAPYAQASYEPPVWAHQPKGVGTRRRDLLRSTAGRASGAGPTRLSPRQRAVGARQGLGRRRLASDQHRASRRRRGALPYQSAELRPNCGRPVHHPVGADKRNDLSPLGRHRHHHRLPRRPAL